MWFLGLITVEELKSYHKILSNHFLCVCIFLSGLSVAPGMQMNRDLKTSSDWEGVHGACSFRPETGVVGVFVSLYALHVSHSTFCCTWLRSVIKMNDRVPVPNKPHCWSQDTHTEGTGNRNNAPCDKFNCTTDQMLWKI